MTEIETEGRSSRSGGGGFMERHKAWAILYSQSQSLVSSLLVNLLVVFSRLWHTLRQIIPQVDNIQDNQEKSDNSEESDEMAIQTIPITLSPNSEEFEAEDEDNSLIEDVDSCSGYCSGSGASLSSSPTPNSNIKQLHHQTLSSSDENEHEIDEENSTATLPQRRDSGTSESSEVNGEEISPETVSKIVSQVESMFSDDHLAKDGFLLKHVRRRSDGFVSLKLVAGLRKVKQISRDFSVVMTSLKASSKLELNAEGTKVRRVDPLSNELKAMPIKKKEKSEKKVGAEKENDNNQQQSESSWHTASKRNQTEKQQRRGSRNYNDNNSKLSSISSNYDETPQVIRRRGGSLPIPSSSLSQKRGSTAGNYLYPNASPPNGSTGFLRPKSNSYSEGTDPSAATMSSWLQKRKSAASSRLSNGEISLNGALRQPRGPDGTKGFHSGYRRLIVEERLQREMMSQLSTFSA